MKKIILIGFFAILMLGLIGTASADDSLKGLWHFEEGEGTTTQDSSGNSNHGTLMNMDPETCWIDGKIGKALEFDGVDDYVDCGTNSSLNITDAITIEAWVKPNVTDTIQEIYSRGISSINKQGLWLEGYDNGKIRFAIGNGTDLIKLIGNLDYTASWQHIVGTWDGTTMKIYINSILDPNTAIISGPIVYAPESANIGQATWGGYYFNGTIDEVGIYSRALSADEVYQHYLAGDARGNWHLNEGSGTTTQDSSGNGNDGTLMYMDTDPSSPDFCWVDGNISKALKFDGDDDYVDFENDPSLQDPLKTEGTLEFWAHPNSDWNDGINHFLFVAGSPANNFWMYKDWNDNFLTTRIGGSTNCVTQQRNMEWGERWYHIVLTWEGIGTDNATIKTYINGGNPKITTGSSETPSIGNIRIGNSYSSIDGLIDEAKIYNRALENEEVWYTYIYSPYAIDNLEKSLQELEEENNTLPPSLLKTRIESEINDLNARLEAVKGKTGSERYDELKEISLAVFFIEKILIANQEIEINDYIPYIAKISNVKVFPDTFGLPEGSYEVFDEIEINACRGEYEPASFVLNALQDLSDIQVIAPTLEGTEGSIASSNVDIKVVKCWYVAGEKNTLVSGKFFTPELLLKDDSLVYVDTEEEKNYLKLTHEKGTPDEWEEYVDISGQEGLGATGRLSTDEFPVYDSSSLLPVNIPDRKNKQFWVTVKIPEDAASGIYTGDIEIKVGESVIGFIKLKLNVLSFELSNTYPISSIYYKGGVNLSGGLIATGYGSKSEIQFRSEMENCLVHGVTNPTVYVRFRDIEADILGRTLEIRNEVGMGNQPLYSFGECVGNPSTPEELELLKQDAQEFIAFCTSYGVTEVYFCGIDEARGELLESQRPAWEAIREVGGKIFVAGYTAERHPPGNFALMGDIQDLFICYGRPREEEASNWHSVGHQIACYNNPQTGVEEPETYRRNFGFLLWQNDYDGAMNHAYQCAGNNNIWNDFDGAIFREECFAYPTVDGVVDTIEWEGYREGIDDVKYLFTLIRRIEDSGGDPEAEEYLNSLKNSALKDLDKIRSEIIAHILRIKKWKDGFDTDKGWTYGTNWECGSATASSGHNYGNPDPAADHTSSDDNYVMGAVIGGNVGKPDNPRIHNYYYATSPVINCDNYTNTTLAFYRWLNSDCTPYMQNRIDVWDGTAWVNIWITGGSPGVQDNSWQYCEYDVSNYADGNPEFQVRFGYNVGHNGVYAVSGWNIDDVVIEGD